jgi:hypothetical protein
MVAHVTLGIVWFRVFLLLFGQVQDIILISRFMYGIVCFTS